MEKFKDLLKQKEEAEKHLRESGKEAFAAVAKEVFDKYGDIVGAFGWTQYTPYFNDGEPCEFSAGDVGICTPEDWLKVEEGEDNDFLNYGESSDEFSNYRGRGTYPMVRVLYKGKTADTGEERTLTSKPGWLQDPEEIENPDFDHKYGPAHEEIHEMMSLFDDALLRDLFGDHVKVVVTVDGVQVEDYEHE